MEEEENYRSGAIFLQVGARMLRRSSMAELTRRLRYLRSEVKTLGNSRKLWVLHRHLVLPETQNEGRKVFKI
ncbi:hypothetical protein DPMN_131312 [Dreissena polymorpha]|uniref:Uncharacterized protein n=1 Tax=Dreissena polymorpha TaxID=45954 RepID=A0A9D4H9B1_DREPO|nr:hypothetical protein DPMN_131312 [Dreissena polymorpha]